MNNKRREKIREANGLLGRAKDIITDVKMDEQYALDNVPENLEWSERYQAMEDALDALGEAESLIEEAQSHLDEAAG